MKIQKKIGLALAIIHLIIVIFIAYCVATPDNGNEPLMWVAVIVIDLPISLGFGFVNLIIESYVDLSVRDGKGAYHLYRDLTNFILPSLYFGILGTLWWFYIPTFMSKIWCLFCNALKKIVHTKSI